jgi:hypothetical protein
LNDLKTACIGKTDEELVTIQVDKDVLMEVYRAFSEYPEGLYSAINQEMNVLLLPQVAAGMSAGNEDWVEIASQLEVARLNRTVLLQAFIANAKVKLGL